MIILKKYGERAKLYYIDTDKILMKASDIIKKKKKKKQIIRIIYLKELLCQWETVKKSLNELVGKIIKKFQAYKQKRISMIKIKEKKKEE